MTDTQTIKAAQEFLKDPSGVPPETIEAAADVINAIVEPFHRLAESVASGVGMDPAEVDWNELIAMVSHGS